MKVAELIQETWKQNSTKITRDGWYQLNPGHCPNNAKHRIGMKINGHFGIANSGSTIFSCKQCVPKTKARQMPSLFDGQPFPKSLRDFLKTFPFEFSAMDILKLEQAHLNGLALEDVFKDEDAEQEQPQRTAAEVVSDIQTMQGALNTLFDEFFATTKQAG